MALKNILLYIIALAAFIIIAHGSQSPVVASYSNDGDTITFYQDGTFQDSENNISGTYTETPVSYDLVSNKGNVVFIKVDEGIKISENESTEIWIRE